MYCLSHNHQSAHPIKTHWCWKIFSFRYTILALLNTFDTGPELNSSTKFHLCQTCTKLYILMITIFWNVVSCSLVYRFLPNAVLVYQAARRQIQASVRTLMFVFREFMIHTSVIQHSPHYVLYSCTIWGWYCTIGHWPIWRRGTKGLHLIPLQKVHTLIMIVY
jgi:hypothetical protein